MHTHALIHKHILMHTLSEHTSMCIFAFSHLHKYNHTWAHMHMLADIHTPHAYTLTLSLWGLKQSKLTQRGVGLPPSSFL